MSDDLTIDTENTWCPGCGNFSIEAAAKSVIKNIGKESESAARESVESCPA